MNHDWRWIGRAAEWVRLGIRTIVIGDDSRSSGGWPFEQVRRIKHVVLYLSEYCLSSRMS